MWKIVALVVLCGLPSPSEGKPYAVRTFHNPADVTRLVTSSLMHDGLLLNHFKRIAISNVDIITGLKIVNFQVTSYEHAHAPEVNGGDVTVSLFLDILGQIPLDSSDPVRISLEVTLRDKYALKNFHNYSYDIPLIECCVDFGAMEIAFMCKRCITRTLPSLGQIRDSITADINFQICDVLKNAFKSLKDYLVSTVNVRLPLGPYGTLSCRLGSLPSIYDTYASADVHIDVEVEGRGVLSIPDSAGTIDVPLLNNFTHCQAFHPEFFNILLSALAPRDPQQLSCIPDKFSGADELRNAIFALIHVKSQGTISESVLYIQISLEADPRILFGNENITVSITLRVKFFFRNADGSVYSVLVLRSCISLSAEVSLVNRRLIFITSIARNSLVLIASDAGISDVSSLEPHCGKLLREVFLPVLNGRLGIGIPVLSVFTAVLINPIFQIIKGVLVACI